MTNTLAYFCQSRWVRIKVCNFDTRNLWPKRNYTCSGQMEYQAHDKTSQQSQVTIFSFFLCLSVCLSVSVSLSVSLSLSISLSLSRSLNSFYSLSQKNNLVSYVSYLHNSEKVKILLRIFECSVLSSTQDDHWNNYSQTLKTSFRFKILTDFDKSNCRSR